VSVPLSFKVEDWPQLDQDLWAAARKHQSFLSGPSPARKWSPKRCRIVEQATGQWLSWLDRNVGLDAEQRPEDRVTPERIEAFVKELQSRVAPASVGMMIGALKRMLEVVAPKADWDWLTDLYSDLKANAKPSRNKMAHMVSPEQVYDLGIGLMQEAREEDEQGRHHAATKGRDGLMIATLACCPVRIANLLQIEIGHHLLFDSDRYWLAFSEEETKTGVEFKGELPPALTPWIEEYLQVHRRKLLARARNPVQTRHLWIDRWGQPMAEASIRAQIEKRTRDAFGSHIWPHLFRAIAVTGLIDHAPEHFAVAPDLLGHSNDRTTRKHYVLSQGMQAHNVVQDAVLSGRAEAFARLKQK
jgi:integrase/recombinase XerD